TALPTQRLLGQLQQLFGSVDISVTRGINTISKLSRVELRSNHSNRRGRLHIHKINTALLQKLFEILRKTATSNRNLGVGVQWKFRLKQIWEIAYMPICNRLSPKMLCR